MSRASHDLARVRPEDQAAARLGGQGRREVDDPLVGAVAGRVGEADLHPQRGAGERERVEDVVAVADEREDDALEPAEPLLDREEVGQRLARMLAQREAVDHRDVCLGRQLHDHLVRTRPDDDAVHEPLEVVGDVADALARAEDHVVGEVDGVPAELGHARLEGHPRAQARLLEEHREGPPGERRRDVSTRVAAAPP